MQPSFKYLASRNYIRDLDFEYIETYSLQTDKAYAGNTDTQFLIDNTGGFHKSAKLTHVFKKNDVFTQKIKACLLTAIKEIPAWMCAPVFRDAIVFYNADGNIASCPNICFSCQYMMLNSTTYINADTTVYPALRQLFINIGHNIPIKNNCITRPLYCL